MVLSGRFAIWNAEEVLRIFGLSNGLHRLDVFGLAALRGFNALTRLWSSVLRLRVAIRHSFDMISLL
jgi:hypothetical protein